MRDRKLQQAFNSLGLIEIASLFSNEPPPASHITGLKQICRVWISPNILPSTASMLPHYFGVGDYRYLVLDFLKELFLGDGFIPIYKPGMWRLTTKQPKSVQNYISRVKSLIIHHCINRKIQDLINQWVMLDSAVQEQ